MEIKTRDFGKGATLISITNKHGDSISFTDFGARIVSWKSNSRNVVLGLDSVEEYQEKDIYPGAIIGRTAGRIKDGKIDIAGETFQLEQNEGSKNLHGGKDNFANKFWKFEIFEEEESAGVHFDLTSPDGENGFPGNLNVRVTYSFDEDNRWTVKVTAQTDRETVFNPTNHVYFNLNGTVTKTVDNHCLKVAASRFVPLLDKNQLVRGDVSDVTDSAFDFRSEKLLSEAFQSEDEQIALVNGIDHPFLLDQASLEKEQARLTLDNMSLSVFTDRPSIVIFTANFNGAGAVYQGEKEVDHGAITFETQVSPGSQQIPELGDISLKEGQTYQATTIFQLNSK